MFDCWWQQEDPERRGTEEGGLPGQGVATGIFEEGYEGVEGEVRLVGRS